MTPKKSSKSESDAPSFDERLQRLEEIVGALEEGGLGLESALERYREGVELLGGCRELLEGYRRQVEELGQQVEGELTPYAGDPDVDGDTPEEA